MIYKTYEAERNAIAANLSRLLKSAVDIGIDMGKVGANKAVCFGGRYITQKRKLKRRIKALLQHKWSKDIPGKRCEYCGKPMTYCSGCG